MRVHVGRTRQHSIRYGLTMKSWDIRPTGTGGYRATPTSPSSDGSDVLVFLALAVAILATVSLIVLPYGLMIKNYRPAEQHHALMIIFVANLIAFLAISSSLKIVTHRVRRKFPDPDEPQLKYHQAEQENRRRAIRQYRLPFLLRHTVLTTLIVMFCLSWLAAGINSV